jgi:hypothetical protein
VVEEPIWVEIYWVHFEIVNVNSQSMPTMKERKGCAVPDLFQRTVQHGFPAAVVVRFVDERRQLAMDIDLHPRHIYTKRYHFALAGKPHHVFVDPSIQVSFMHCQVE